MEFVVGVKIRFGTFEDLVKLIAYLQQIGKFSEYQESFDRLSCKVDLSEAQKLSCYLARLKIDLATRVKSFCPKLSLKPLDLLSFKI